MCKLHDSFLDVGTSVWTKQVHGDPFSDFYGEVKVSKKGIEIMECERVW